CGEEVKEAITRSNWGALCDSLSFCASITAAPASGSLERRPPLSSHSDGEHHKGARQGDKDKPGKESEPRPAPRQFRRRPCRAGRLEDRRHSEVKRQDHL
ncbi:hypothetical protein M9458_027954, partial [Cirrhinus mrigala]